MLRTRKVVAVVVMIAVAAGTTQSTSAAGSKRAMTRFALYTRIHGCSIETGVNVLPDLNTKAQPFARVRLTVSGLGYDVTRHVALGTAKGYTFGPLFELPYTVSAYYPGDRWRTAAGPIEATISMPLRCHVSDQPAPLAPKPKPVAPARPAEGPGSYSHADDATFCSAHQCIGSFTTEPGYIVQCSDGTYSHSGGISGSCSRHGGNA